MQNLRPHLIFYSIIAMMGSLFISRGALSASIIVFVSVCFFHTAIKEQLRNFFSTPLLWAMSLLFLLPLLSGLWSDDRQEWLNSLRVKLPLLVLPLAFASPFTFSRDQWRWLASIFLAGVMAGTIWSMFHYVPDMQAVNEGYLQAKTILTPLENDHVRFSWLLAVAILVAGWVWLGSREQRNISWLLLVVMAWLIIFLHILAARTGLLCFYMIVIAAMLWMIVKKTRPLVGAGFLVLVIALPLIAYIILPTFRNKVKYFRYDFEYFKDAHYLPGGNDAIRVISLKAGWHIMNDNAVKGVGFGDIFHETGKWYEANYPQMRQQDKIFPSNEWLIYGTGCGIPGFLIFTFVLLVPFFTRVKSKGRWWLLNGLVATSFLFDIGLEVQFGVFIYSFIVLLSWKWFRFEA
ncbi:MAG TPA: O-antigen ligase family protein [Chitinophagaceae bacterium]